MNAHILLKNSASPLRNIYSFSPILIFAVEVRPERRQTLGLRWITLYSRQRSERTMKERLANEIMDAVNSTGSAYKKKVSLLHPAAVM